MDHQLRRVARQHLETSRLLGVNFMPVAMVAPAADLPSAPTPAGIAVAPNQHEPDDAPQARHERSSTPSSKANPQSSPGPSPKPSPKPGPKQALLDELRRRHDSTCPHCTTCTSHTQTVFGEGDPDAAIMFVGEAPGEEEDRTGRPFVGRAGQKLDDIIRAMGLSREQVYIANVLKARPPENRTPLQHEVDACGPFLAEQIRIIHPKVIVALGGPASKLLLHTDIGITRLRGQFSEYADGDLRIPVMPTFHPAYVLRNYTVDTRQKVWSDMQAVLRQTAESSAQAAAGS